MVSIYAHSIHWSSETNLLKLNFVKIKSSFSFKGIYASNGVNSKFLYTLRFTFESNGCD